VRELFLNFQKKSLAHAWMSLEDIVEISAMFSATLEELLEISSTSRGLPDTLEELAEISVNSLADTES